MTTYFYIDEPETGLIDGYYIDRRPTAQLKTWDKRRPQYTHSIETTEQRRIILRGKSLLDIVAE